MVRGIMCHRSFSGVKHAFKNAFFSKVYQKDYSRDKRRAVWIKVGNLLQKTQCLFL